MKLRLKDFARLALAIMVVSAILAAYIVVSALRSL